MRLKLYATILVVTVSLITSAGSWIALFPAWRTPIILGIVGIVAAELAFVIWALWPKKGASRPGVRMQRSVPMIDETHRREIDAN